MGAQLVREVASKTSDVAGDGTTTATVLAHSIYSVGIKHVVAGSNPMDIKRGIEKTVERVVEELKKISKPVQDKKEIAQVGAISANNDASIGELIAEAMDKVGKDGVITVEQKAWQLHSRLSRECSSTGDTSHHILLQTLKEWSAISKTFLFSSMKRKFPQ